MSVAGQARYPDSILCRFLDRYLPQRAVAAEDWARRAASAPWTGISLPDAESRQRIGVAAEIRIGLDLSESPAYGELLSFLPAVEYSALLNAVGFGSDENKMADGGTTDPLLPDWRRVHQPIEYDEDQRVALAACMEAAGMRNVQFSFSDRSDQARRYFLTQVRSDFAGCAVKALLAQMMKPGMTRPSAGSLICGRGTWRTADRSSRASTPEG